MGGLVGGESGLVCPILCPTSVCLVCFESIRASARSERKPLII